MSRGGRRHISDALRRVLSSFIVSSSLEYCASTWDPHIQKDKITLENSTDVQSGSYIISRGGIQLSVLL